jgi:hypothetical protein
MIVQRPNPKKNMVYGTQCRNWLWYDPTVCPLQSRLQHIYHEATLCQSRPYPYARVDLIPMPESTLTSQSGTLDLASEPVYELVGKNVIGMCYPSPHRPLPRANTATIATFLSSLVFRLSVWTEAYQYSYHGSSKNKEAKYWIAIPMKFACKIRLSTFLQKIPFPKVWRFWGEGVTNI